MPAALAAFLVAALLLFSALRRMLGSPAMALLVAALYALHPVQVESVAWAAERKGLIAAVFWMLAMEFYSRNAVDDRWRWKFGVFVSMAIGLMAKSTLLVLPFALLGITAGAYGAFLAGRALGRSWVEKRMGDSLKLQALDEAVNAQSFYIVFLTRFAIVLPFNVLNYAFGLTRVKAMTYISATALGMLPAVLLYVYLGTLADDFGAILAGDVRPASGAYWIAAIAIVAIVAVIWIVQRAAKRALRQKNSIS